MPHREPHEPEPSLFDLPLAPPPRAAGAAGAAGDHPRGRLEVPPATPRPESPGRPAPVAPTSDLPLEPALRPAPPARRAAIRESQPTEAADAADGPAPLRSRVSAGFADLVVHAALAVAAVAGSALLGVRPQTDQAAPVALFVLTFSFVYTVIPLAFWGQTLGMVWAGLVAQNQDGEPLTFDQSARRWFGQLLILLTAGLPLIATGNGRSVADLLSGSETHLAG
jgi:uncharacterized RDD family membrane protein YckC